MRKNYNIFRKHLWIWVYLLIILISAIGGIYDTIFFKPGVKIGDLSSSFDFIWQTLAQIEVVYSIYMLAKFLRHRFPKIFTFFAAYNLSIIVLVIVWGVVLGFASGVNGFVF